MQPSPIRILLADSDYLVCKGLESLLAESREVSLEEVSSTGNEAIDAAQRLNPDLVLMESQLRNVSSVEATQHILASVPSTKVVMFSSVCDLKTMTRAHSAGASSYLSKCSIRTDLAAALRMIYAGNVIYAKPTDAVTFPRQSDNESKLAAHLLMSTSSRDKRLISALVGGNTNKQISALLHVSPATVKGDLVKIMERLNVINRVQLAVLAVHSGLLDDPAPDSQPNGSLRTANILPIPNKSQQLTRYP
ncbi:DNA-binding response regulator, NarL/FixJ family, contains REC and HTH domains [Arthrobacter alpinus]|uniref:DNA-binding response regulator, NarL/FixJ family, contains REC and HTH domains n=1 Tax=Arthrobacter alpinus TaxID=656366 RepID=A0A1H5PJX5_9MICC|nr:DNA-binding response regulator, NarL/FixJ family, contains REC and HTH domains [Arthrobacter alpinus]